MKLLELVIQRIFCLMIDAPLPNTLYAQVCLYERGILKRQEVNASRLLETHEEMFPRFYTHSNMFFNHTMVCYPPLKCYKLYLILGLSLALFYDKTCLPYSIFLYANVGFTHMVGQNKRFSNPQPIYSYYEAFSLEFPEAF